MENEAEATDADVSEAQLAVLVDRFYARVRRDPGLGPVFERAVQSWDEHLHKLTAFWSTIMLASARYKGNPMIEHRKHLAALSPELFTRWLALWGEVTSELMSPPVAARLQAKAARMSENLQAGLFHGGLRPRG